MFEVGFTEIVLIFGIALLVLGPARLPKLAADLGRWAGRARAMARQLRTQLEQEVQFDPLATPGKAAPAKPSTHHASPAYAPAAEPPMTTHENVAAPVDVPASASTDTTPTTPDERQPG